MKKLINNKILLSIIMAIFSYITICFTSSIKAYDLYSWIFFLILILFFYNFSFKENKNVKKGIIVLSLIFSILLVVGRIIVAFQLSPSVSFLKELLKISNLVYTIGNFNLLYTILNFLIPKLMNLDKMVLEKQNKQKNTKWVFIISFIILLFGWSIYLLAYYPGIMTGDSMTEITFIMNKFVYLSDHHTIMHIMFISLPLRLGLALFNNINMAAALVALTQMIILDLIFSYTITFLYKRNVKIPILILILLFYLLPLFGFYSITMWKDVIFGGSLLLLTIETIKMLEKDKITIKNSISFILVSLLNIFFRNNAIYAYFILIFFTFIFFKKSYKQLTLIFIIVVGIYGIVKNPVFDYFDIKRTSSSEYIAIPLQQIGRMAYKNVKFTKKEEDTINNIIPVDTLKVVYNPVSVDNIKFHEQYSSYDFDNNKMKYLKLWLNLVVKHPVIAVESYLTSTVGYWYPNLEYWSITTEVKTNNYGIHENSKSPQMKEFLEEIISKKVPILSMSWSIGLCFWLILVLAYVAKKRFGGGKWLYPFIPTFGIWLTMMIATPVYAEFRYIFGAYCCLPLLMLYSYIKIKK